MNRELLSGIHSWEPSSVKWQELLDRLHPIVGAESAGLIVVDTMFESTLPPNQFNAMSKVLREPPSAIQTYNQEYAHYEQKMVAHGMTLPPGAMLVDPDSHNEELFRMRPDVAYSMEKFGVLHRFGVRLNDQKSWHDVIAFQYALDRGNATSEEFARLQPYIPHIAQAIANGRMYDEIHRKYSAVLSMLDRVNVGMLLLRNDLSIVISNEVAREVIDSKPSLSISSANKLVLKGENKFNLSKTVAEISLTSQGQGSLPKRQIAVGDDGSGGSVLLELSPLYDRLSEADDNFNGVFVLIVDPDRAVNGKPEALQKLYGLTPAEQEVATLITEGEDYKTIAERRNSSRETIRSHTKRLFQKMQVNSRSEIVRKLLQISLPFKD